MPNQGPPHVPIIAPKQDKAPDAPSILYALKAMVPQFAKHHNKFQQEHKEFNAK